LNIPLITPFFAFVMKTIMNLIGGDNGVSFALAILLFTIFVKLLLFPLQLKSKKGMVDQQRVAPKIAALEKKYRGNKQKYQEEVSKVYKEEGVSLMGGCLPTVLTLVIVLGLYTVIYRPLTHMMNVGKEDGQILAISQDLVEMKNDGTYVLNGRTLADCATEEEKEAYRSEVGALFQEGNSRGFLAAVTGEKASDKAVNQVKLARLLYGNIDALKAKLAAETAAGAEAAYSTDGLFEINFNLFGLDLGDQPGWNPINILIILPILSGVTSFFLSWVTQRYQKKISGPRPAAADSGVAGANSAEQTSKMMMYMMPIMSVVIGFMLPAGITVYWILNNLVSAAQEPLLYSIAKKRFLKKEEETGNGKRKAKAAVSAPAVLPAEEQEEDPGQEGSDSSDGGKAD
jgi:YidC/Oxa1 family membrane protein insertase